jgi:hypothetical protein
MVFARFIGASGAGLFVRGKVYLASSELGSGAVDFQILEITDENGETIREDPDDERFEYPGEVYAAVVVPFGEFDEGEVVVVNDAKANGDIMLNVSGVGFVKENQLAILDGTVLRPGTLVEDEISGRYLKITKVDESGWLSVGGDGSLRSPSEFRFFVSDGEILLACRMRCVDDSGEPDLTQGALYRVTMADRARSIIVVINDVDKEKEYLEERFAKI